MIKEKPREVFDTWYDVSPPRTHYTASNYCFLFGIPPGSAGIRLNMPLYRPLTYREVTYLCSDSLEKIRLERETGDNRAAGALWKALLEIFPKV